MHQLLFWSDQRDSPFLVIQFGLTEQSLQWYSKSVETLLYNYFMHSGVYKTQAKKYCSFYVSAPCDSYTVKSCEAQTVNWATDYECWRWSEQIWKLCVYNYTPINWTFKTRFYFTSVASLSKNTRNLSIYLPKIFRSTYAKGRFILLSGMTEE